MRRTYLLLVTLCYVLAFVAFVLASGCAHESREVAKLHVQEFTDTSIVEEPVTIKVTQHTVRRPVWVPDPKASGGGFVGAEETTDLVTEKVKGPVKTEIKAGKQIDGWRERFSKWTTAIPVLRIAVGIAIILALALFVFLRWVRGPR